MRLFGSSGIRGEFNKKITPELVCRIGQAVGNLHGDVAVGWDARTTSPLLANAAISGLLGAGCNAYSAGMVSTPTLANAAREYGAGIMITASHNPPTDNGVKLWNPDGSSFGTGQMEAVESLILDGEMPRAGWDRVGRLEFIDWAIERHMERISRDIGKLDAKVVVDCGNGAATSITPRLLEMMGCRVITINGEPDGSFPGRASEPTEENTKPLAKLVLEKGADLGIAHDGDGDRMVAVDDMGNFAGGDALMPLLCRAEGRTKVVVPVNASMAVDRYLPDIRVIRCRVGDVYVSEKIKEENADFGAEPSGTWVFPKVSYCPDGVYAAARLIRMAIERPLSQQLAEIPRLVIKKKRVDMPLERSAQVMAAVKEKLMALGPSEVSDMDGVRAVFDGGWMLLRPSGTEPKLKLVAEAETEERAGELYDIAMGIIAEVLK